MANANRERDIGMGIWRCKPDKYMHVRELYNKLMVLEGSLFVCTTKRERKYYHQEESALAETEKFSTTTNKFSCPGFGKS